MHFTLQLYERLIPTQIIQSIHTRSINVQSSNVMFPGFLKVTAFVAAIAKVDQSSVIISIGVSGHQCIILSKVDFILLNKTWRDFQIKL